MKNDMKPWHENLMMFIIMSILLLVLKFSYKSVVFEKGSSTGSQAIRRLLRRLHNQFGEDFVFGLFIVLAILFGILTIVSYNKEQNKNKED